MREVIAVIAVFTLLAGCQAKPDIPPPLPRPSHIAATAAKRVVMIGDSYLEQGPEPLPDRVSKQLRDQGQPIDLAVGSEGGTGYVNVGTKGTVFGERAARLVTPDTALVVFVGGANDGWPDDLPTLAAAVHDTFAQTRKTVPHAKLLVIGPIDPDLSAGRPPAITQVRDIVRDQAAAVGATFVDPIADEWLVGHPELLKADGLHPNGAGNDYLAEKVTPLVAAELAPQ